MAWYFERLSSQGLEIETRDDRRIGFIESEVPDFIGRMWANCVSPRSPKARDLGHPALVQEQTVKDLEFSSCRLADIGQKARMGGAALGVVGARIVQAQGSIDGEAHIGGVFVLLAIVLPPADRAQGQSPRRLQRLESAARATKMSIHHSPFVWTTKRG